MTSMVDNVDKLNSNIVLPFDQVVHVIPRSIDCLLVFLFLIIARPTKYFYSSFEYNPGNRII